MTAKTDVIKTSGDTPAKPAPAADKQADKPAIDKQADKPAAKRPRKSAVAKDATPAAKPAKQPADAAKPAARAKEVKEAEKPAKAAKPKTTAKTADKPAAKTPAKAAAKPAAKPAPKSAEKPAPKASAKPVKAAKPVEKATDILKEKPRKERLVRDSFTMPEAEYAVLGQVKKACLKAGFEIKKSELLRIGVALISQIDMATLQNVLASLPQLKTGRPKKA
jgi:hypothetical protein